MQKVLAVAPKEKGRGPNNFEFPYLTSPPASPTTVGDDASRAPSVMMMLAV